MWSLINPIFRIAVYYFAFGFFIFRNREAEFILYLFTGIITWNFFSSGTSTGLGTLFNKRYLLESTDVNRFDLFVAGVITVSLQFFLSLVVYVLFSFIMDVQYSWLVLYIFPIFITMCLITMATSMILSIIKIYVHDINQIWNMVILVGFWTIPVIWDYHYVYDYYPIMLYINPFTGIVINMRFIFVFNEVPDLSVMAYDFGLSLGLFIAASLMLNKMTKRILEIK